MVAVFAVDTSCMVAAVCTWHEHHAAAAGEIERRLGRGERMAIPAPALVEAHNTRHFDPSPKGVLVVEPAQSA